jgi:hypothetical protein
MRRGEPAESIAVDELDPELTIWATPAIIDDQARRHLGSLPLLTLVPSIRAHTSNPRTGAEQIDVIAASLLRAGFAVLPVLDMDALSVLPPLLDWQVGVQPDEGRLQILEPTGTTLYDGDLGASPPPGWYPAVHRRRNLVVLVANGLDLTTSDRHDQIQRAAIDGRIVGAHLPLVAAPRDHVHHRRPRGGR